MYRFAKLCVSYHSINYQFRHELNLSSARNRLRALALFVAAFGRASAQIDGIYMYDKCSAQVVNCVLLM